MNGASKTYAMTGWRVGFGGGPTALITAMFNMQGQATAGVSTVGQAAAPRRWTGRRTGRGAAAEYRQRRDMVVEMLNAAPGITCHKPEGAFYVFPNIAGCLGKTTQGRPQDRDGHRLRRGAAGGEARRGGAGRGLRHEPLHAHLLRHRHGQPGEACGRIQEFCRELR